MKYHIVRGTLTIENMWDVATVLLYQPAEVSLDRTGKMIGAKQSVKC